MQVKIVSHEKELGMSRLEFNIKGDSINYIVVNSIKRMIQSEVPIYAFNDFEINENTSVFNNNYLKLRWSNIPIWGIDNTTETFQYENEKEESFNQTKGLIDDIELTVDNEVNHSSINKLSMYVDYYNDSLEKYTVTTDNAKFYYKGGQIDNPYKVPIPLVDLQSKQKIKFTAIGNIGIEDIDAIFSPCSVCFYKQNGDHDFNFILESRGQISEKRILVVAIKLLIKKLHNFYQKLPKNNGIEGDIVINNEDHTLGNLITFGLNQHKMIVSSGYYLPHPLKKQIVLNYKLESGNINSVIKDVVSFYEKLYDSIKENFSEKKTKK